MTDDLKRAEDRYAEALADLRRFEYRMGLAYVAFMLMLVFGLVGLAILKVLQ